MRTLYLSKRQDLTVRTDGPSLWIEEKGKAGRRIPLRLIGRVVVSGNILLESDVLILLAENNIPVSFLTRRGTSMVSTIRVDSGEGVMRERVEKLKVVPWGIPRVKEWLSARRSYFRMETLKRFNPVLHRRFSTEGFREDLYRRWLHRVAPGGGVVFRVVRGILYTCILERLQDIGFDPHSGFIHREDFGLVKDFLYALAGEMERHVIQFFYRSNGMDHLLTFSDGQSHLTDEGMKDVVFRFENQRERIYCAIDLLLDDLFTLMREVGV